MEVVEEEQKTGSIDTIKMQYLPKALLHCGAKSQYHLGRTMKKISSSKLS